MRAQPTPVHAAEADPLAGEWEVPATWAASVAEWRANAALALAVAEPMRRARALLGQSRQVSPAAQPRVFGLIETAAQGWFEVAQAVARTVQSEQLATSLEQRLSELRQETVRTRALAEQERARLGRLSAELSALSRPAVNSPSQGAR